MSESGDLGTAPTVDTLPELKLELPQELIDAGRLLVENKYDLDRIARGRRHLVGDLWGGYNDPLEGTEFFRAIFPFAPVWNCDSEAVSCLAPTSHTFGSSWKWRRENLAEPVIAKVLAETTDPAKAERATYNSAQFMWIEPLGLLLPNEGKNRVDFLREMGVTHIPASVHRYGYPAAGRIALYQADINRRRETWAILDGQYVERLKHPTWATPILDAYGVQWLKEWPDDMPDISAVDAAFERPSGAEGFLNSAIVDTAPLRRRELQNAETVNCGVLDIEGVALNPRLWFACAAIYLICSVVLFFTHDSWNWTSPLYMVVGAAVGMIIASSTMAYRTTRDKLKRSFS